ncbi:hypothetical protein LC55x_0172 [Lysobacter capsici]|nr:hypothetical protein LC55x_0172 [Lysobacter capsici]
MSRSIEWRGTERRHEASLIGRAPLLRHRGSSVAELRPRRSTPRSGLRGLGGAAAQLECIVVVAMRGQCSAGGCGLSIRLAGQSGAGREFAKASRLGLGGCKNFSVLVLVSIGWKPGGSGGALPRSRPDRHLSRISFPSSGNFRVIFRCRHSREGGNPGPFVRERLKSLDSRFRGNDVLVRCR